MKFWMILFFICSFVFGSAANIERLCLETHGDGSKIEAIDQDHSVSSTESAKCHHQSACQHCHIGQFMMADSSINLEVSVPKIMPPAYSGLIPLHSSMGFFKPPIA